MTEQGKQKARNDWHESSPTWDEEHHLLIAQQSNTLKAVGEWLIGYCSEGSHRYYGTHMRRKCNACMITAGVAFRKGEVPGEGT